MISIERIWAVRKYSKALYFCSYWSSLLIITISSPLLSFLEGLRRFNSFNIVFTQTDTSWLWCACFHLLNTPSQSRSCNMLLGVILMIKVHFELHFYNFLLFAFKTFFHKTIQHLFSLFLPFFDSFPHFRTSLFSFK